MLTLFISMLRVLSLTSLCYFFDLLTPLLSCIRLFCYAFAYGDMLLIILMAAATPLSICLLRWYAADNDIHGRHVFQRAMLLAIVDALAYYLRRWLCHAASSAWYLIRAFQIFAITMLILPLGDATPLLLFLRDTFTLLSVMMIRWCALHVDYGLIRFSLLLPARWLLC